MQHLLATCSLAALLGGCAALERIDREEAQRACDGFGFRRGTEAYSSCMMQQAAQRAEEDQRALDRAAFERRQRRR